MIHCRKFVGYVGLDTKRDGVLLDCLLGSSYKMKVAETRENDFFMAGDSAIGRSRGR